MVINLYVYIAWLVGERCAACIAIDHSFCVYEV